MHLSIDATGELYEFVRYPANWETVRNNLSIIKESLPNADLRLVPVVGPINIFGIFDVIRLSQELDITLVTSDIITDYYGWNILTGPEKELVKTFILSNIKTNNLTDYQKVSLMGYVVGALRTVEFDPNARQTAVARLATMCKSRKISADSLKKVFQGLPELGQEIIDLGNVA